MAIYAVHDPAARSHHGVIKSNRAQVVYWLHEQHSDIPVVVSLDQVIRAGDSAFLQWLFDHKDKYDVMAPGRIVFFPFEHSDLAMIQWVVANLSGGSFHERTSAAISTPVVWPGFWRSAGPRSITANT